MELAQLPNELIFIIASYLSPSEIYALIQTSHELHECFHGFLYYFDGRYNYACALPYAVRSHIVNVQSLLEGLRSAPRRNRVSPLPPCCHQLAAELQEDKPIPIPKPKNPDPFDTDEDEEWMEEMSNKDFIDNIHNEKTERWSRCCFRINHGMRRSNCERHFPMDFWQEFAKHPLYQNGYSMKSILNIQNGLVNAIREKQFKIVALLLNYGAQPNFYCAEAGCWIPDYAWDWKERLKISEPPLCVAVSTGDKDIVNLLFDHGAQPDLYPPSPLYLAVEEKKFDLIPILLQHGVWPQDTALKLAVLRDDLSTVKYLLDEGLDPKSGSLALYSAKMKGNGKMVEVLESQGITLENSSQRVRLYNGSVAQSTSAKEYQWKNEDQQEYTDPWLMQGQRKRDNQWEREAKWARENPWKKEDRDGKCPAIPLRLRGSYFCVQEDPGIDEPSSPVISEHSDLEDDIPSPALEQQT